MRFSNLCLVTGATLSLGTQADGAFRGGTEIAYCENKTYPVVIDTASYL